MLLLLLLFCMYVFCHIFYINFNFQLLRSSRWDEPKQSFNELFLWSHFRCIFFICLCRKLFNVIFSIYVEVRVQSVPNAL